MNKSKLARFISAEELEEVIDGGVNTDITDPAAVTDVIEARSEFDENMQVASEALDAIDRANALNMRIFSRMALDANKLKQGSFSKEDLEESISEFKEGAEAEGFTYNDKLDDLATESADITMSLEALDGERKTLAERIGKSIDNAWGNLTNTLNNLDAAAKLIKNYDTEVHKNSLSLIQSGGMVKRGDITKENIDAINKKLAIYYAMGNTTFSANSFIKHINLPYQLIVEKKLYTYGFKEVYNNLIVSVSNEKPIPIHKESVDVLDSFTIPEVRKWLNKDTKAGLVSNFIGNKFSIVSVYQDSKGSDARHDFYDVPASFYVDKNITGISGKDIEAILKAGIELKVKGLKIAEAGKKEYWTAVGKSVRSSVATQLFSNLFGILAIKRVTRQFLIANEWATGSVRALLHLKKSHIDTGLLITKLVNSMYEKK